MTEEQQQRQSGLIPETNQGRGHDGCVFPTNYFYSRLQSVPWFYFTLAFFISLFAF